MLYQLFTRTNKDFYFFGPHEDLNLLDAFDDERTHSSHAHTQMHGNTQRSDFATRHESPYSCSYVVCMSNEKSFACVPHLARAGSRPS